LHRWTRSALPSAKFGTSLDGDSANWHLNTDGWTPPVHLKIWRPTADVWDGDSRCAPERTLAGIVTTGQQISIK
ncbi:MAG: hypothetical protein ACK4V1_00475, partial [Burkholderiaceae bacterium]